MDLAQVKTAVKTWEKAFKAQNKREPTKEDIKKDTGGIAEQYALYRKLSKPTTTSGTSRLNSSSQAPSSTSTSISGQGTAGTTLQTQRTPRIVPNSDYPTTPTPPSRRAYVQRPIGRTPLSMDIDSTENEAGPSRPTKLFGNATGSSSTQIEEDGVDSNPTRKRTASKANLSPRPSRPSTSLGTFLTPRKPRPDGRARSPPAYTGPVIDPNPMNPFLASPSKNRVSPFTAPYRGSQADDIVSPFIHASSPRKLKEVLEANSLRKVRARMGVTNSPSKGSGGGQEEIITPRTKARKRLRGEVVEDTPVKAGDKPRRRRGQHTEEDFFMGKGKEKMMIEEDDQDLGNGYGGGENGSRIGEEEEEYDSEEGMGPSPEKDLSGQGFLSFSSFSPSRAGISDRFASAKSKNGASIVGKGGTNGNIKSKGKMSMKGDARQTKMNTFFQRSTKIPKVSQPDSLPPPTVGTNGTGKGTTATASSSSASSIPLPSRFSPPHDDLIPPSPDPADMTATHPDSDPIDRLPTPPPNPEVEEAAAILDTPSKSYNVIRRRTVKRLTASSEDDDDGEDGIDEDRDIVIIPTRRDVDARYRRRGSMSSLGSIHEDNLVEEMEDEGIEDDDADEEGTPLPSSSTSLPPHLISLLSIRSPTKPLPNRSKTDLVVKALFDPEAARRLKATQRGQDVRVGGADTGKEGERGEDEDEDALLDQFEDGAADDDGDGTGGGGGYGDDDWEEEDEGWKRPGDDMDDAW